MSTAFVAVVCSAVAGFWAPLAVAQQKTVQQCRADLASQQGDLSAKGITELAYVDEFRSFRTAPTTIPAAAEPGPTPRPTAAPAHP
jgi:hypothetical protein